MGAGASAGAAPFESVEAALAGGKTQEEVDSWISANPAESEAVPAESEAAATPAESEAAATPAESEAAATPAESEAAAPAESEGETQAPEKAAEPADVSADGVDRSEIERNKNGEEEPSSADPELWNVDNCEVDILVKYKMGGQMWYVQSRMRENTAKSPALPIPGFPMNKKATDAKRYYATDEDGEFNKDSTNFCNGQGWKDIQTANPPVEVKA
jgi:hypothetical protein